MIPSAFSNLLQQSFSKIGFKESKGAVLGVNEYSTLSPEITPTINYNYFEFNVEALFERNVFKRKVYNSDIFLLSLKKNFVVKSINPSVAEKNRVLLILTLQQINSIC